PDPVFIKMNQTGGTTYPRVDPTGAWGAEEALDVEWVHALAPQATIFLIEASDAQLGNLVIAVGQARNIPQVSVVSMSLTLSEDPSDLGSHPLFTTPAGHQGISFIAGAGDTGAGNQSQGPQIPGSPATDPNVLAVGGTSLFLDSQGNYQKES